MAPHWGRNEKVQDEAARRHMEFTGKYMSNFVLGTAVDRPKNYNIRTVIQI